MRKDKRRTGEGAMKGWETRRRKLADRRHALAILQTLAEDLTGAVVLKTPVPGYPRMMAVTVEEVINWRDRAISALRRLS